METDEKTIVQILSRDNPVFSNFVAYSSLLIIKFMLMSILTAIQRMRTKVSE